MFFSLQNMFRRNRRRGQVAVFLLMILTVLAFVLLWDVDIHHIITTKTRSQNASDAAALAGARWQGIGINLVGELNLLHALALSANDAAAVDAITNMQARVLFTAPMMGLAAAQVAAKNNGMYAEEEYTQIVLQHVQDVKNYGDQIGSVSIFPPPYPGAWDDYATMLQAIADDGIAAGPDNTCFYNDSVGGSILLLKNFYSAVAGKTWCWFYLYYPSLLQDYTDYKWWPPLPPPVPQAEYNSEFLPLGLKPYTLALNQIISANNLWEEATRDGVDMTGFVAAKTMPKIETWYVYDTSRWKTPWQKMNLLPLTGTVRSEYDYAGADVMFRVQASVTRMTPGLDNSASSNNIPGTAAARPFGAVGPDTAPLVPFSYGLVFPSFSAVRLIPIPACSSANNGTFDIAWRHHVDVDLPLYQATGAVNGDCWYCQQLALWENPTFRQTGIEWLSVNSYLCTLPTSGGGGGGGTGGGSSVAH